MTPYQAQAIMDAHDIDSLLSNDEERALLDDNNPELLGAYEALAAIAAKLDPVD